MKIIDPLFGFKGERLIRYIQEKPLNVGDEMMICNRQTISNEYQLVTIEAVNHGRQRRVIVSAAPAWGGRSFYRNGKNCFSPKGQSRLIPVIICIKARMSKYKSVTVDWDWEPSCFKLLQMVINNDPELSAHIEPLFVPLRMIIGINDLLRFLNLE